MILDQLSTITLEFIAVHNISPFALFVNEKTKSLYPAPLKALEVVKKTYSGSLKKGLEKEFTAVTDLFESAIPKNLMSLFFAQENIKKLPELQHATNKNIKHVGVFGAGLMGGGMAWWFVNNDKILTLVVGFKIYILWLP